MRIQRERSDAMQQVRLIERMSERRPVTLGQIEGRGESTYQDNGAEDLNLSGVFVLDYSLMDGTDRML